MKGIMKPFTLEEYLANPNKKVVTRDGRNAKIICTNFLSNKNVIAEVESVKITDIDDITREE